MKFKVKSDYKSLTQMKWCCAACAVLWILHRRGYWVEQADIAREIKIRIPKKDLKLFSAKMAITRKRNDYGAPDLIGKDAFLINQFLKRHKIPLKMNSWKIGLIENPKKFIVENIKKGNDVMLSFHWRGLGLKGKGHVAVLAEIDDKENTVIIGDSAINRPKFWKVKLDKLVRAMSAQYDHCERGFYIFEEL